MWSGILLHDSLKITRLTNNNCEVYFNILKNDCLQKRQNLMPSEIASGIYLRSAAKYAEFYQKLIQPSTKKVEKAEELKEIWAKSNVKRAKIKGYYYNSPFVDEVDTRSVYNETELSNAFPGKILKLSVSKQCV
jgi:hypothetical protein